MRTLTLYMAALVSVLGIASASQSAVIIDFEVAGSNPANSAPSATVTVDIYLTATGTDKVTGYQFAIKYSNVSGGASLVNAPTHSGSASWITGGPGLGLNTGTAYAAAISSSTLVAADDITAADGAVKIGSITFHVDAVSLAGFEVTGCFDCTIFGPTGDAMLINGVNNMTTTTFHGLEIVPEPTTASLLGLGLLGLTVAGRRRN